MTSPPTFCGKILKIKNQPAKFDKTDYQTLPIKNFSLYLALLFHGHMKRLCPDPIVGLGARLGVTRQSKSIHQLTVSLYAPTELYDCKDYNRL